MDHSTLEKPLISVTVDETHSCSLAPYYDENFQKAEVAAPASYQDSVEPIDSLGRLVILEGESNPLGKPWAGENMTRYRCISPEQTQDWQRIQTSETALALCESQAVVLTADESDAPVGNLAVETLIAKIHSLWGGLLPPPLIASAEFHQWLEYFITHNHDYGIVHAWVSALREWLIPFFCNSKPSQCICCISKLKYSLLSPVEFMGSGADEQVLAQLGAPPLKRKTTVYNGNSVIAPDSDRRPRRIWDVCAHRVVPTTWFPPDFTQAGQGGKLVVISHAWVSPNTRKYILTAVNCHTWPVPLPSDVKIQDIRQELLRRNVRFAWLDILCLRQDIEPVPGLYTELRTPYSPAVIAERKAHQLAEWVTDVPLIGSIYRQPMTRVLVYLRGVGKPCVPGDWRDERHWLRRAWTLQELRPLAELRFAGLDRTGEDALLKSPVNEVGVTFETAVSVCCSKPIEEGHWFDFQGLITALQDRCSTNPVDLVGSLLYFLRHECQFPWLRQLPLPVYNQNESVETAWKRLVHSTAQIWTSKCLLCRNVYCQLAPQLCRIFPHPSAEHWFPSWLQLMRYPDVSLQEEQLPDGLSPAMQCPLRLYGGHIYRGITLKKLVVNVEWHSLMCPNRLTQERWEQEYGPGLIVRTGFRATEPSAYVSDNPWSQAILLPPKGAEDLTCINEDEKYVLVDITPINYFSWSYYDRPFASDLVHIILVCKELTQWREPAKGWDQKHLIPASFDDPSAHHYKLRRVTTLTWIPPQGPVSSRAHAWLPLPPAMRSMSISVEVREGVMENDLVVWDPSTIVTLQ